MKQETLYIKINKNYLTSDKVVRLEEVATIYSTNISIVNKLNHIIIFKVKEDKKKFYCFSVILLFKEINRIYPDLDLQNLGDTEFIVEYEPPKKKSKIIDYLKVVFVGTIIFFGAGFTIMTFNVDAGVEELFDLVYELILGKEVTGGGLLEISYAIGLPVGIIVFFDHFSKVKMGIDPTPMQVQIRMYEENLDKTIIENASRKDELIDSD